MRHHFGNRFGWSELSQSASAEPSESTSPETTPSEQPSAAPSAETTPDVLPGSGFELNPGTDVPDDLTVKPNENGSGTFLTGISVSIGTNLTNVTMVQTWIVPPAGGSIRIIDPDGQPVPPTAPVGTGA